LDLENFEEKKIFRLKKNFDEKFFGLGQFLKKKFFFGIQNFNIYITFE